jgi:hypothetical protein
MARKHTAESIQKIASQRNHTLVNMDGYENAAVLAVKDS